MLEHVRTWIIVTIFASALWVFAESESLGEHTGVAELRFVAPEGNTRLVIPDDAFDGAITIDLVGSKGAIARCETELAKGIELQPGMTAVPASDGTHTINLLRAIEAHPMLTRTGARVSGVSPQVVDVQVLELEWIEVPIDPALEGIEASGEIRLSPPTVRLRLPKTLVAERRNELRAKARLDASKARRLPASGPVREEAEIVPPAGLTNLPGFESDRNTVTIEFTVQGRTRTDTLRSIPVLVVLPPIEVGRWNVEVNEQDRFLSAEVTGPRAALDDIAKGGEAIVAVAWLSSDELQGGVESKSVSFMLLKNGAFTAPTEVQVNAERTDVRLRVSKSGENGAAP